MNMYCDNEAYSAEANGNSKLSKVTFVTPERLMDK